MWRTRAVRRFLLEEVAGVRFYSAEEADESGAEDRVSPLAEAEEDLDRLRRRARVVIGLDLATIAVLVYLRWTLGTPGGAGGGGVIFELAVLAVALHAGFRLGQLGTYDSVARLNRELAERDAND